jgi:hypothetical protein
MIAGHLFYARRKFCDKLLNCASEDQHVASGKPVLLRVDYQGGHGTIGGTRAQVQELYADQWSFLLWQFGVPGFQPAQAR